MNSSFILKITAILKKPLLQLFLIFSFIFFFPFLHAENPHFTTHDLAFASPVDSPEEEYAVGGNDILKILVYDEPELSSDKIRISLKGFINMALIGQVKVEGLTTSKIEEKIENLLRDGYLLNPQVSILVEEYRSQKVFVLGAVQMPSSYELRGKTTLLEIISKAGGILDKAGENILILRKKKRGVKNIVIDKKRLMDKGDLSLNTVLQNNDTIYIPAGNFVYVFGEVSKPGSIKLNEESKTVLSAITMAGGFTEYAAPKKTKIVRVENGKEKTIFVNVEDIIKRGIKSRDIELKSGDMIIVPESLF